MKRNEQLTAESGLSLQNDVDLLLRILILVLLKMKMTKNSFLQILFGKTQMFYENMVCVRQK